MFEESISRTLFYQHFFGKDEQSKDGYYFDLSICEQMFKLSPIQVSHADNITGATPLEHAIYQKDLALVKVNFSTMLAS